MEDHLKNTINAYSSSAKEYEARVAGLHHVTEGEFFMQRIPKGGKILDVGCADGRDCKVFSERGFKVTGIDLCPEFLEIAQAKVPTGTFLNRDMRHLDFKDNCFDGVWSCASIVHMNRSGVIKFLGEAYRVLKDEGVIYLAAKEGPQSTPSSAKTYFFYDKKTIKEFIAGSGLKLTYLSGANKIQVGNDVHSEVRAFARK